MCPPGLAWCSGCGHTAARGFGHGAPVTLLLMAWGR